MRFSASAVSFALAAALVSHAIVAAADEGEGLGLHDEIGVAMSIIDGEAEQHLRSPVLVVAASFSYVFPSEHGVGLGFDFAWDVSGAESGTIGTYFIDLFYLHAWRPLEDWEVTPIVGASIGWVDASLPACVSGECSDEEMMASDRLDRLDSFAAGGKVGFGFAYVLADFIHLGASVWVRVMAATGDEEWNVLWSQALLGRLGFRFDL